MVPTLNQEVPVFGRLEVGFSLSADGMSWPTGKQKRIGSLIVGIMLMQCLGCSMY